MTSLTKLSLANRLIVGLAALAVVVFGVVATTSLRQELLPSTDVPTAAVTATYPGASPEIVADEVAGPLEQAISGVDGVTTVRATSTNGVASLVVEWDFGLDSDEVTSEIRSAVDGVPDLPAQVETEVLAISTDDIPVQVVAVASDTPVTELGRLVDEIAIPQLTEVDGVRQVQVAGQNVTELAVTLRPAQLRKYDINAAAVTQAIRAQALVVPAGTSYDKNLELAIEVGTTPTSAKAGRRLADPGAGRAGQAEHPRRDQGPVRRRDVDRPVRRPAGAESQHPQGCRGRRGVHVPDHRRLAARPCRRAWGRTRPSSPSSARPQGSRSRSTTWPPRACSAWPSPS